MLSETLELALDQGPYRLGEKVRGRVVFVPHEDVKIQGATVSLFWRTCGFGNVDVGGVQVVRSPAAVLTAFAELAFPFEFPLPVTPISFMGPLVAVEWVVEAKVDLPWAKDPRNERVIEVHPRARREKPAPAAGYRSAKQGLATTHDRGLATANPQGRRAAAAGGVAVIAGGVGAWQIATGMPWAFFVPIFAAAGAALVFMALPWARNATARTKLGDPVIELGASAARGESLPLTISLTPAARVHIEGVHVTFSCTETATSGSGDSSSHKTHDRHRAFLELTSGEDVSAGSTATWNTSLPVPPQMPPSFRSASNAVIWKVLVQIAVKDWPDHEEELEVTVWP